MAKNIKGTGYSIVQPVEGKKSASVETFREYFEAEPVLSNKDIGEATGYCIKTVAKYRKEWLAVATTAIVQEVTVEVTSQSDTERRLEGLFIGQLTLEERRQQNNFKKEEIKELFLSGLLDNPYTLKDPKLSNAQSALISTMINHG